MNLDEKKISEVFRYAENVIDRSTVEELLLWSRDPFEERYYVDEENVEDLLAKIQKVLENEYSVEFEDNVLNHSNIDVTAWDVNIYDLDMYLLERLLERTLESDSDYAVVIFDDEVNSGSHEFYREKDDSDENDENTVLKAVSYTTSWDGNYFRDKLYSFTAEELAELLKNHFAEIRIHMKYFYAEIDYNEAKKVYRVYTYDKNQDKRTELELKSDKELLSFLETLLKDKNDKTEELYTALKDYAWGKISIFEEKSYDEFLENLARNVIENGLLDDIKYVIEKDKAKKILKKL